MTVAGGAVKTTVSTVFTGKGLHGAEERRHGLCHRPEAERRHRPSRRRSISWRSDKLNRRGRQGPSGHPCAVRRPLYPPRRRALHGPPWLCAGQIDVDRPAGDKIRKRMRGASNRFPSVTMTFRHPSLLERTKAVAGRPREPSRHSRSAPSGAHVFGQPALLDGGGPTLRTKSAGFLQSGGREGERDPGLPRGRGRQPSRQLDASG